MAVVTRKSTAVTNRDATPRVVMNAGIIEGRVRSVVGTIEAVSGDSAASVYVMASVPTNCYNVKIALWCDDIGTAGAFDIGLYRTTADGSAAVDADFFATAVDLSAGAIAGTRVEREAGTYDAANIEQPLWQAAGVSADPGGWYDICLVCTTATNAAGTISLDINYSV